jgi:hypothetical protein
MTAGLWIACGRERDDIQAVVLSRQLRTTHAAAERLTGSVPAQPTPTAQQ